MTQSKWLISAVCLAVAFVCTTNVHAESPRLKASLEILQKAHRERQLEFVTELEKLAIYCEEHDLPETAHNLRSLKTLPDWQSLHLEALPTKLQTPIPNNLPETERYWRTQLRFHQTEYAKQLYLLARRVVNAGFPGFAYNLIREAVIHDPDHVYARKLLGYVRYGEEWVTPFAAKMLREQYVWTSEFGWLRKSHLDRYLRGNRYVNGKWVSKEKEAEIRRDFRHAWEIRTDHFLIRTNHSREKALELGQALEDFYEMFFQTFAGFFNSPEQLKKLFDGTGAEAKAAVRPHVVHYYRTRQEYIDLLKNQFPQIDVTNGIYLTTDRVTHFYHIPEDNQEATLFHEATHQLFHESHAANRETGELHHYWIIEGIACYMESFQRGSQGLSLGDPRYIRFAGARYNLLTENYYVPLREFMGMGMREFQTHPQLVKNYTQASGLAHFFMHYDDGNYREALVTHLSQLYSANARIRSHVEGLDVLTGVSTEELDRQYAEYQRELQQKLNETLSKPESAPNSGDETPRGS